MPIKLSYENIIKLTTRYIYRRGNTYYYQRKIPLDLINQYGGIKLIKVNLKTTNLKQIAKKIFLLNKKYESIWSSLRDDSSLKPLSIREAAIKLLATRGLNPLPYNNDEMAFEHFIESFNDKRARHAQRNEEIYWNSSPDEYLNPVEAEAVRLIYQTPKFRLSDAINIYLNNHVKKDDDVRWLLALQIDLGRRLVETTGLAIED